MTLLEEARGLIKDHLASKPHLSIASMARACGMPPTTARTIIQGEVRKTALENIVALLSTFMSYEAIHELVEKYDREKFQTGSIKVLAERKARIVSTEGFEWEDPDHEIAALASSSFGTTRERIGKLFGEERGLERLEALLGAGILREINGKIKQPEEFVAYSIKDSQQKAAMQADRWKQEDIDDGGFLYHLTQNYTDEGHAEALALTRDYISKMANLEQKYKGGDRILMLSIVANLLRGEKQ
ncbi:MAG: hypothetical protein M3Q07_13990 [Pseudobdellovibrionaceae bacterium]|nr:hypothetical protein [Pseudobdellovibrionaceae bacterium]